MKRAFLHWRCRCYWWPVPPSPKPPPPPPPRPHPTRLRPRPAKIDSGDTAWMLTSTALVLMMTIPGLALFYGGMVRKKNILATLMQSFAICCLITIIWMVAGYSLAFTNGSGATAPYIGDLSRLFLNGIAEHIAKGDDMPFVLGAGSGNETAYTIPETVYMMYQMTFAIITPALIAGAFADRMKFSAMCVFMVLWSLIVYCPIAHMVWSATGIVGTTIGAIDFAGGTVVHINAGVAGLVCALVLGKRVGYGQDNMSPFNLTYAVIGASLLWVGWFGFNAGSAVAAGGRAGMAMTVTQIATGGGGPRLDVRRVGGQGQAVRARHHLRRGGGAGRDHPGVGLRAAGAGADHRHRGGRGLLLVGHRPEAHAGL